MTHNAFDTSLTLAAHRADADWSNELNRVYGREACNARYDSRGKATPRLAALFAAQEAAFSTYRAAWLAYTGSNPHAYPIPRNCRSPGNRSK